MFKEVQKYIISLPNRQDRRDNFILQAERLGIKNYNFFAAIENEKGWLGCLLSHKAVIESAKHQGLKYVCVMEDDVIFCNDFMRLIELTENTMPIGAEMFYLGGNNNERPIQMASNWLCHSIRTLSTVGYIVSERMYDKILALPHNKPIDVLYADYLQQVNVYCAYPNLVWQMAGYSDVLKTNINYQKEYKYRW